MGNRTSCEDSQNSDSNLLKEEGIWDNSLCCFNFIEAVKDNIFNKNVKKESELKYFEEYYSDSDTTEHSIENNNNLKKINIDPVTYNYEQENKRI